MDDCGHCPRSDAGSARSVRLARRTMMVLMGALVLAVAAPALAGAHPVWTVNDSLVSKSTAVEWNGQLKLNDTVPPQDLECTEKAEGSVGVGGTGEITKMTATKCIGVKGCAQKETKTSLTALNLPWHTELVLVGGSLYTKVVNGGKGTPGFKDECVDIITVNDECTGTFSATTTNGGSGVAAAFNSSEKLNCTVGGTGSGIVEGSQTVTVSGGVLSAQKEVPLWLKNGVAIEGASKSIEFGKKLSLYAETGYGDLGVTCEDHGEGVAGETGMGSIAKITLSSCKPAPGQSGCQSEYGIEALHLPWSTQLLFEGAVAHEFLLGDGAGTPGFVLKCEVNSTKGFTDTCTSVPSLVAENNTEHGVLAEFGSQKMSCTIGGAISGSIYESPQTINLTSGETLHVS